ncbi:MAG: AtpZ/AtpI family protein [Flavobacteriales bacterium]|nr:AtpZ/AtpI family protein [Flavobacteriales bacterium]
MSDNHNRKNGKKKPPNAFLKYSGMAAQMAAIIVGGALGGIKLDEYLGNQTPYFTGGLTILSVILAMFFAIKDLLKG